MGKLLFVSLALLVVLGFTHGVPSSNRPDRSRLVQLLKKALGRIEKKGRDNCPDDFNFEDIFNLEHLYTLPSSNFLVDVSHSRMSGPLPMSPTELIDEFFLDPSRVGIIEAMTMSIEPYFLTPATFATAVAMEMYPVFLDGKINCPATVLNKFMIRLWDEHYRNITRRGEIYRRINESAIAVFPTFETKPAELRAFVGNATEEMHKILFNDTATLTLALGLRDVANAAHILYYDFLAMKSDPTNPLNTAPFFSIIQNAIDQAGVKCNTGDEIFNMHKTAGYIFLHEYEGIEVEHVCHFIGEYIYSYLARRVESIPGVDLKWLDENLHWDQLGPLCTWFKDFIHTEVAPGMYYYQHMVENRLTEEFLSMFTFLKPWEITVLEDVLIRLGFPPKTPRLSTPRSQPTNESPMPTRGPTDVPTTGPTAGPTVRPTDGPVASQTPQAVPEATVGMKRKFGSRVLSYNPTVSPNGVPQQFHAKRYFYAQKIGRVLSYNPTVSPNVNPLQINVKRYPYSKKFGRVLSYNPTSAPKRSRN